jgi:Family of unknown function (DUF6152)
MRFGPFHLILHDVLINLISSPAALPKTYAHVHPYASLPRERLDLRSGGVNSSMKGATMRGTAVAVIGTIVLAGSSARAHHGYANFLINQNVSIEGDIEEFRYANPHIVLKIRTADSTLYTATWEAPKRVERAGVKRTTLKVGDHVIVTGAPPRDPASHELMPVREIHRPRDGWRWPG